jgi:hypothetical protein
MARMGSAEFCYVPLDHQKPSIRLLDVLYSEQKGEPVCQLKTVYLDENPSYIALSYCWGYGKREVDARFIYANGERTILRITTHLQRFLSQLIANHPEHSLRPLLWIDAICIDQDNVEERNSQVKLMKAVYQQAESVTVWLGEESPQTNAAMDLIPQLVHAEERAKEHSGDTDISYAARQHNPNKLGLPKESAYVHFVALLLNEWFTRVWIIQEVAMAKQAYLTYGPRSVRWDDFAKAFLFLFKLDVYIQDPGLYEGHFAQAITSVLGIIDARDARKQGQNRTLLGTLLRCRPSRASKAEDKVFAVLGLATDTGSEAIDIEVDYAQKVERIYTDTAFTILRHEQNLDLLGVQHSPRDITEFNLPSWVPDWSVWDGTIALNRRDRPASLESKDEIYVRHATGNTVSIPRLSADGRMLGLHGYVIDQVMEIGMIYDCKDRKLECNAGLGDTPRAQQLNIHVLLQWEEISKARGGSLYAPTGEPILAAYWQTITAGWRFAEHDLSTSKFSKWDSYRRPGASLRQFLGSCITMSSLYAWITFGLSICKQLIKSPPEFGFDGLLTMSSNRRFIQTKKGYMGLAPAETRVGDSVALFKGGGSPLVMRREGENWTLVGDSYVHGMMNAECWVEGLCQTMWLA